MNKVRLGYSEMTAFLIIMIVMKIFIGYPRIITEQGATAAWLLPLFSGLLAIGLWLLIMRLLERFPGKSLAEITELLLGPVLGLAINIIVVSFFCIKTALLLRVFCEATTLTILTETPLSAIALLFLFGTTLTVYHGIEAISRSASIALPYIIFGLLTVLVILYPYYDFKKLLPIMGVGGWPLLKYTLLGISSFAEVIALAYLIPFVPFDKQKIRGIGVKSISITMFLFTIFIAAYLMTFQYPTSTETFVPVYQLSRSIFLGHYLQRVEAFFVIFAVFTAFLRLAMGLFVTLHVLKDTLRLPNYHPLLAVFSLLLFTIAFTPKDVIESVYVNSILGFGYSGVAFALPLLLYMLALLRKKGETRVK
jgi:spore germination protein (amino acid permease)